MWSTCELMWSMLCDHVIRIVWYCDLTDIQCMITSYLHVTSRILFWMTMWSAVCNHVICIGWSCDLHCMIMWSAMYDHVICTVWSCDLHCMIMWSALYDHVICTVWSCDWKVHSAVKFMLLWELWNKYFYENWMLLFKSVVKKDLFARYINMISKKNYFCSGFTIYFMSESYILYVYAVIFWLKFWLVM